VCGINDVASAVSPKLARVRYAVQPAVIWRGQSLAVALDGVRSGDGDAVVALDIGPYHHVILVGGFAPYLREFIASGRPFTDLERDPEVLKPEELPFYVPAARAAEGIPDAHPLLVTGNALIHDSLKGLPGQACPGKAIVLIGLSMPLWSDPSLECDVGVVRGVRFTDAHSLLECLAGGGSRYHFFGRSAERITLAPIQMNHGPVTRVASSAFFPRFH